MLAGGLVQQFGNFLRFHHNAPQASSEHWTASAMGFGKQLYNNAPSSNSGTVTTNSQQDEGGGASARATWAPLIDDSALLHFGLSAQFQKATQKAGGSPRQLGACV